MIPQGFSFIALLFPHQHMTLCPSKSSLLLLAVGVVASLHSTLAVDHGAYLQNLARALNAKYNHCQQDDLELVSS
jgi:hypothetical protein